MRTWLAGLFRRADDDVKEELEFHLQMREEMLRDTGLAADDARATARRRFGNRVLVYEDTRAVHIPRFVESVWQDVQYGFRSLANNPGFAVAAIVTLALGIGANSAIFQVLDAVVLRPLPVRDPHQLVRLQGYHDDRGNRFSYPLLREMAARQTTVEGIFASEQVELKEASVQGRAFADSFSAWMATGNYFRVLGTEPQLGRFFTEMDDHAAAEPVAVVSHAFWRRELGSAGDVLGQTVRVNGVAATIVGVSRREFQGERIGTPVDIWLPLAHAGRLSSPSSVTASAIWLQPMARVREDVPAARAQAELSLLWDQLKELSIQFRGVTRYRLELVPAAQGLGPLHVQFSRPLWLLMGIVALLALLASCNIANLLLARATAREREIAVRVAIGAGRRRIVRQLLTESLVLCTVAGGIGLLVAVVSADGLVRMASAGEAWRVETGVNWRVMAFTAATSLAATLVFGLAPAFTATRVGIGVALKGRRRAHMGRSLRSHVPGSFVVAQVALSFLLVAGASLLIRSFWNLTHQDFGFEPDGVLMAELDAGDRAFGRDWMQRVSALSEPTIGRLPGAVSAAVTGSAVLGEWSPYSPSTIALPDRVVPTSAGVRIIPVSAGYLETMRIPVLRGRPISHDDRPSSTRVAVINETAARVLFGDVEPVGERFAPGKAFPSKSIVEVVGVMQDHVFDDPRAPIGPLVFVPLTQGVTGPPRLMLRVAHDRDREMVTASLRAALREHAPYFRLARVRPLSELVRLSTRREHLLAWLSGAFGALGLFLAGVGLYGVAAYSTKHRTHEIGVRMALGARPSQILRSVITGSVMAVSFGIGIGLVATMVSTRYVESVLFGLTRNDPATMIASVFALLMVGTMAAYVPARRAARSDPVQALRHE